MRKVLFLSFLILGIVAAVPHTHAAPVCSPVHKTSPAGTVDGTICFYPIANTLTAEATVTMADKTVYKLMMDGGLTVSIANGKPVFGIQADMTIKDDEGTVLFQTHATFAGSSLNQVLTKFTSMIANLPKTV